MNHDFETQRLEKTPFATCEFCYSKSALRLVKNRYIDLALTPSQINQSKYESSSKLTHLETSSLKACSYSKPERAFKFLWNSRSNFFACAHGGMVYLPQFTFIAIKWNSSEFLLISMNYHNYLSVFNRDITWFLIDCG